MAKKKTEAQSEVMEQVQPLVTEDQSMDTAQKNTLSDKTCEPQDFLNSADMDQGEPLPDAEDGDQDFSLDSTPLVGPESNMLLKPPLPDLRVSGRPEDSLSAPDGLEKEAEPDILPAVEIPAQEESKTWPPARIPSERQSFYELDFNELDRDLSNEERQEWNSIYAAYRSRSALTGTIIGVDRHTVGIRNRQTGEMERQVMFCAIVVPFRVRIVIPEKEMWDNGQERPNFVLQNMVGAKIDFLISKVDREGGFAIGSRRLASRARRYYFARRPALNTPKSRIKCRILAVGPRRCLVECYGHDIDLTQREIRYTAIPDLRTEYHPGDELECIVKSYDPEHNKLGISVKETKSNPFDGADLRHPVGSRRQAVIAGKYGGGVFCNLPDGTVCMCAYSFQYEDSEFQIGDIAIVVIQRFDMGKKQIYGKIISKW